jgi:hypothetical protein
LSELPEPSAWAQQRFGTDAAKTLRRVIPAGLQEAHRRALSAHLGSELSTQDAYGIPLAVIQHQVLVDAVQEALPDARRIQPPNSRYELAMINNVVLYPWRYAADTAASVENARLRKPVSELRKALLTLHSDGLPAQLTLDQAHFDEADFAEAHAVATQLSETARLVLIAYASNTNSGLLRAVWGDAELLDIDQGALFWHHMELLPPPDADSAAGPASRPRPAPQPSTGSAPRFDDAPLPEPQLGSRAPLGAPPTGEAETAEADTGSDDDPR